MENENQNLNSKELIAIMTSRILENDSIVFTGVGLPIRSVLLAKELHAPNLVPVFEGGGIDPQIKRRYLPQTTNEARLAHRPLLIKGILDMFNLLQKGYIDYGIIGGAQIDKYGNVNSTVIGDYENPKVRLTGSGGANAIATYAKKTIVIAKHEKRRFVKEVDYITSPGYISGEDSRKRAGLVFGKIHKIVTDLAILGFDDETKRMKLEAVHSHTDSEEVREKTGFTLEAPDKAKTTSPPTEEEINALRKLEA